MKDTNKMLDQDVIDLLNDYIAVQQLRSGDFGTSIDRVLCVLVRLRDRQGPKQNSRDKYIRYCDIRKQQQRKYLSYYLWNQEYVTGVDLQMEGALNDFIELKHFNVQNGDN